jgi:hypothetical protein
MADAEDDEKRALLHFLHYQRDSVLSIVEGLDEQAWHRSVVPSGWTPAGLVEHLGDAERHWFQRVVAGSDAEQPWDEGRLPYDPEAAFVCNRPSAEVIGFDRLQVENGRSCSPGFDLAIFLISRLCGRANVGGQPPLYFGYREPNPSVLKLPITSGTRSSLVNATFAIAATSMPCAEKSTICARRQVTTDPLPRRTIRTRRRPSSSSISQTRSRSATPAQSR